MALSMNLVSANDSSGVRSLHVKNVLKLGKHPTVKPIKLMEYLVKLATPTGGVVLDPFMGSGTTGVAELNGGFDFIGCELEPEYFNTATERLNVA